MAATKDLPASSTGKTGKSSRRAPKASSDPAAHIMPPPKGFRRVSHARIKAAVEAVIRARKQADA